jgi:hypothetical protein
LPFVLAQQCAHPLHGAADRRNKLAQSESTSALISRARSLLLPAVCVFLEKQMRAHLASDIHDLHADFDDAIEVVTGT